MKRILLVGCDYFPLSTPGSFRLHAFARHLPEFGYEPRILTLDWDPTNAAGSYWGVDCLDPEAPADPCPVTRFYYRFPGPGKIRSLVRQYTVRGLFPLAWPLGLTRLLAVHMERLHAQHRFHLMLTTAPYYPPLPAARRVQQKSGLPWVLDFRDLKGQVPFRKSWIKPWHWLFPAYEKWAISRQAALARAATAVTTVSEPMSAALARQGVARVSVVSNGFAPEEFPTSPRPGGTHFHVVYAGTIIPGARDPAPLLDALDLLCCTGKISDRCFALDFYGVREERIKSLLARRACAPCVHLHPRLGKRAIHEVMAQAGVLLHLSIAGARGLLTSKLTEYLGAGRPILTVPGDGDVVDKLLERTQAGVSLSNPAQIAAWLLQHYEVWKTHGACLVPEMVREEVEKYTWRAQVRKLAEALDAVEEHRQ